MYEQCHCHLVKGFSHAVCYFFKEANIKKQENSLVWYINILVEYIRKISVFQSVNLQTKLTFNVWKQ